MSERAGRAELGLGGRLGKVLIFVLVGLCRSEQLEMARSVRLWYAVGIRRQ